MQTNRKEGVSKTINQSMQLSSLVLSDPESVWVDKGAKSIAYFCKKKPVKVDKKLIKELKEIAASVGNKNIRLCLHESPDALSHDMIILERKGKYYRPHKHLTKGESFHIIEGLLAVFIFDESGVAIDSCILEPEGNFIYRVGVNMYHAVMPLSDLVIYHESKPGPFLGDRDSIYPSWSPVGNNPQEVADYTDRLLKILGSTGKSR